MKCNKEKISIKYIDVVDMSLNVKLMYMNKGEARG